MHSEKVQYMYLGVLPGIFKVSGRNSVLVRLHVEFPLVLFCVLHRFKSKSSREKIREGEGGKEGVSTRDIYSNRDTSSIVLP